MDLKNCFYALMAVMLCCLSATSKLLASNAAKDSESQELCYTNYICEGTRWEGWYPSYDINTETNEFTRINVYEKYWIEGTSDIEGQTYLKLWKSSSKDNFSSNHLAVYLRTENTAVYKRLISDDESECLLYDFGLKTNEDVELEWDGVWLKPISGKCVEEFNLEGEDNSLKALKIHYVVTRDMLAPEEEWGDGSTEVFSIDNTWICGIGSTKGILANVDGGFYLTGVYHDDVLVYAPSTSEIKEISTYSNEMIKSRLGRYHLDGTIFKEGDKGLYIERGRKGIVR